MVRRVSALKGEGKSQIKIKISIDNSTKIVMCVKDNMDFGVVLFDAMGLKEGTMDGFGLSLGLHSA